jgi:hypothetical protein
MYKLSVVACQTKECAELRTGVGGLQSVNGGNLVCIWLDAALLQLKPQKGEFF